MQTVIPSWQIPFRAQDCRSVTVFARHPYSWHQEWCATGLCGWTLSTSAFHEVTAKSTSECSIRGPPLEAYTTSGFGAKWRRYPKNVNVLCGEDAAKFHSDQVDAGENAVVLSELKAES